MSKSGRASDGWQVLHLLAGDYGEVAYVMRTRPLSRQAFLRSVKAGEISLLSLVDSDLESIESIFNRYDDQEIDLADACLLHLAEQDNIDTIFTLDRRHFGLLKKSDGRTLRMIPEQL